MSRFTFKQLSNRITDAKQMLQSANPLEREAGKVLIGTLEIEVEQFIAETRAEADRVLSEAIEDFTLIAAKADAIVSGKPWASC
jgi:hypothetical protein